MSGTCPRWWRSQLLAGYAGAFPTDTHRDTQTHTDRHTDTHCRIVWQTDRHCQTHPPPHTITLPAAAAQYGARARASVVSPLSLINATYLPVFACERCKCWIFWRFGIVGICGIIRACNKTSFSARNIPDKNKGRHIRQYTRPAVRMSARNGL